MYNDKWDFICNPVLTQGKLSVPIFVTIWRWCMIVKFVSLMNQFITMEKGFHRSDSLRWIYLKQNMIPFILRQCNKWKFYIIYFSRNDGRKGKRFSHFELSISAIACEQRQQIIKNENDQNRGRDGTLKKETKKVKGWIKE